MRGGKSCKALVLRWEMKSALVDQRLPCGSERAREGEREGGREGGRCVY